jgi:hypothetical protein
VAYSRNRTPALIKALAILGAKLAHIGVNRHLGDVCAKGLLLELFGRSATSIGSFTTISPSLVASATAPNGFNRAPAHRQNDLGDVEASRSVTISLSFIQAA